MLVSYKWLKDYIEIDDLTPQEVAEKLTRSGVEVDIVHAMNQGVKNIVVGKVVDCEKHPEADKLNLCQVDIGEEELTQIVCGAANVGKGQYVVVAKVGARLPGGVKIKRAKLRGQTSEGMICSLQELGFEGKTVAKEYAEGIYNFPTELPPGTDAIPLLNLDDHVLELDLTPNRADCLSLLGVAYEVGAILGRDVKLPRFSVNEASEKADEYISVNVDAKTDSPYYGAIVIKDVKIEPSPLWLQSRLMAAGIRPHNNVVDVTNYVLLEYGQPLHSFDYDRLGSKEVLVRRAVAGEKITTLDDVERTLTTDYLAITNGSDPVALAGVMGGATSEVDNETTNILLEAAYFHGSTIRKASRELGLRSDASARFEKGVDPNRVREAGLRAAAMIAELAGGTVLSGVVEFDELDAKPNVVEISLEKINALLGTNIDANTVEGIMDKLQFPYEEENGVFTITAPTRRQDIVIEADVIEEVARLYGYDNIPTTLPNTATTPGGLTTIQVKKRKVRRFLENAGLHEAVSYSLTTAEKESFFTKESSNRVNVALPMSEERSALRTTLIPHLLDALSHNKNRSMQEVRLYEVGSVFQTDEETITKQPTETTFVSGAIMGLWHEHSWQGEKKPVDFFVAKGIVEGLLAQLNVLEKAEFVQTEVEGFHPGRTAKLKVSGTDVGVIGQVHPTVAKEWSLHETYVFELNFTKLVNIETEEIRYNAIPRFPAIDRDIALVVTESTQAGEVEKVIVEFGGPLLKNVALFDVYQGEHLDAGKKSLAFSLRYQDPEKTLTDEEVTKVHENVLKGLEEKLGATLRS
ncbi:phenylalanine--tRNA ligase subunit beta [Evansella cellulosilytica]|uniref:Phenylalanine--tRNA ligase beta subunit n=1 Tax=Evansella cellulosilytica (strain ATCC 21833 / DSM 2522 / FERM P-1141 / JCM 9156 / N-4) TaxID=649639 RepID=E6U0I1_EVAC2|nr:phenylalanine--tRNA ligase subunit beta [Evansella cellulosilytica]ADU31426.1 phenylalanyl-tRNA synthetase, beta subunit [Evansella cellulosilytica DSM 2522]